MTDAEKLPVVRFPLFYKTAAENGEKGAGVEFLLELAGRLRGTPTPEECDAAAVLFERAAVAGAKGAAAALYLTQSHRPRASTMRNVEITRAVMDLIDEGVREADAFAPVGMIFKLGPGRIKAIFLQVRAELAERD